MNVSYFEENEHYVESGIGVGDCLIFKQSNWSEKMKTKQGEWVDFSVDVFNHIQNYCLPQYGDYPDEMIEGWTSKDIKTMLEKYIKRIGSGMRGVEEAERDTLKIAHYACLLRSKLMEEHNELG